MRPAVAAARFDPDPADGRVFAASRVVRSTDVSPAGRLRLDALARYLQAAAEDDLADADLREPHAWLVRRCEVTVRGYPRTGDRLGLRTFCSGIGPRWAGRTTTLATSAGDVIQARAVWVAVTLADGRPAAPGEAFHRVYGAAAQGRGVSARLSLPGPPEPAAGREWPLRAADFDTAGHVNNAIAWAAVEDVIGGLGWLPASAEMEYQRPILPGHEPRLVTSQARGQAACWLLHGTQRLASARLAR
jgi:acyl-ACP thioesterase